jgi:PAS domain-containing protein
MFVELEHRIEQAVEKQMAEKNILVKNIQANLMLDMAKIASWEYDPETNLFNFDDIFYRLYEIDIHREGVYVASPEEFISDFVHPNDRQKVVDWIQKGSEMVDPNEYIQIEHRIINGDGRVKWVAVRVGALFGPNGRPVKYCGVSQDITD